MAANDKDKMETARQSAEEQTLREESEQIAGREAENAAREQEQEQKQDNASMEQEPAGTARENAGQREDSSGPEEEIPPQTQADDETKRKYAELYDNYLRLLAEYDNFKKRTAKEKDELYARAVTDVVVKLLPVIDNFDRAEQFVGENGVKEGFSLIRKQFNEFLTKLSIVEIDAKGKPFDPNLHEAVFHEQIEGGPENTVAEVLQKGYLLGDRVLRHSMVKVIN